MAKFGELIFTSGKMPVGTITAFFAPSGSTISVTNDSEGNPTRIWVARDSAGAFALTRNRDGKVVYSGSDYTRDMAVDDDPQTNETYTISAGASIVGAMVRRR